MLSAEKGEISVLVFLLCLLLGFLFAACDSCFPVSSQLKRKLTVKSKTETDWKCFLSDVGQISSIKSEWSSCCARLYLFNNFGKQQFSCFSRQSGSSQVHWTLVRPKVNCASISNGRNKKRHSPIAVNSLWHSTVCLWSVFPALLAPAVFKYWVYQHALPIKFSSTHSAAKPNIQHATFDHHDRSLIFASHALMRTTRCILMCLRPLLHIR